jgi:enoyl-CoA hydratase/carnithine racemase
MYQYIDLDRHDEIAIITLNRPERFNAWHSPMRTEVADAFHACNQDPEVRAVVITGAGANAFSAGQDLAETQEFDAERAVEWMGEWRAMYGAIRAMDKPVVAALNGVAAGSAFQVALLCDVRVGHAGSDMGQPEINSGIPSTLGPWLMQDMLGRSRTIELTLRGRMMDGAECHALGLIHTLVPREDVLSTAISMAKDLARKPPIAMKLNKRRFRELTDASFEEAEQAGERIQHEAFESGEPQAAMEQFFAERRARKQTAS